MNNTSGSENSFSGTMRVQAIPLLVVIVSLVLEPEFQIKPGQATTFLAAVLAILIHLAQPIAFSGSMQVMPILLVKTMYLSEISRVITATLASSIPLSAPYQD